jgi:hypothetical protein
MVSMAAPLVLREGDRKRLESLTRFVGIGDGIAASGSPPSWSPPPTPPAYRRAAARDGRSWPGVCLPVDFSCPAFGLGADETVAKPAPMLAGSFRAAIHLARDAGLVFRSPVALLAR